MPKRSNDFQRLIAFIEKELAEAGVKVTESAEIEEYEGSSKREVDVLIEAVVNGHLISIALECRDHASPQDKIWIDGLIGKYRDLKVSQVVAVSSSGFTKGAIEKANKVGIQTLTFEQALDTNWPKEFIKGYVKFISQSHTLISALVSFKGTEHPELSNDLLLHARITNGDGHVEGSFLEIGKALFENDARNAAMKFVDEHSEELFKNDLDKAYDIDVPYITKNRFLEDDTGKRYEIESITLKVHTELKFTSGHDQNYFYSSTHVVTSTMDLNDNKKLSIAIVQFPNRTEKKFKIAYTSITGEKEIGNQINNDEDEK